MPRPRCAFRLDVLEEPCCDLPLVTRREAFIHGRRYQSNSKVQRVISADEPIDIARDLYEHMRPVSLSHKL